jgi:hypothetical protein
MPWLGGASCGRVCAGTGKYKAFFQDRTRPSIPSLLVPGGTAWQIEGMPMLLLATLLLFAVIPDAAAQRAGGVQLKLAGPTLWIRMDTVSTAVLVPGTTAEVFRQTGEAYKSMKIKTNLADTAGGLFGNSGFLHSGSLAGRRMSSWIRCGEGITGPNADNWRISMAILSAVERVTKDTSRVRTVVVATGRNLAEGSSQSMICTSSGQLEEALNLKVQSLAQ